MIYDVLPKHTLSQCTQLYDENILTSWSNKLLYFTDLLRTLKCLKILAEVNEGSHHAIKSYNNSFCWISLLYK